MNKLNQIEQAYNRIDELLSKFRIKDALDKLNSLLPCCSTIKLKDDFTEINNIYFSLLEYNIKCINDPKQTDIIKDIIKKIYKLCDLVCFECKLSNVSSPFSFQLKEFLANIETLKLDFENKISAFSFNIDLNELLENSFLVGSAQKDANQYDVLHDLFIFICYANKFDLNHVNLIEDFLQSENNSHESKQLIISALTIGLLRFFDEEKFILLTKAYLSSSSHVSKRALIGIVLNIIKYDKRLKYYHNIIDIFEQLSENEDFKNDFELIFIQIIRAKDTEKISKRFNDELTPTIIKLSDNIKENAGNFDELLFDSLDGNPNWEKYFDNQPDMIKKFEEFFEMQLEGADIYISAFSALKMFPFFNKISNWFLPYNSSHPMIIEALKDEPANFVKTISENIERSFLFCNSDKYSFMFNIKNLPEAQKRLMEQMIGAEKEQIDALLADELSDLQLKNRRIIIQYIQDLYRFFKLFPKNDEIGNPFTLPFELHSSSFFNTFIVDINKYLRFANFYFDNDHWYNALSVYKLIENKSNISTPDLYQKMAFCNMKSSNYYDAIDYLKKAELFNKDIKWTLSKMAQCYIKINDFDNAITVYKTLIADDPENAKLNILLGRCYLENGNINEALNCFTKTELFDTGNIKSLRLIGWCLLALNRCTEANKIFTQILEQTPDAYDYMNFAHVKFCLNDKQVAVKYYLKSLIQRNNDLIAFLTAFNKDKKYLLNNGISAEDIGIMADYIRYRSKSF